MFTNLKGAWKGAFAEGPLPDQQKENDRAAGVAEAGGAAEGQKGNWLARAANKVSSAASTITTKTASLLDFHSGATDVIVVKHGSGRDAIYQCTSFYVHVARDNKSTLRGAEGVLVYVNRSRNASLSMVVGEGHNCTFEDGSLKPSSEDIADMDLKPGRNLLRFSLSSAPNSQFTANIWLLSPTDLVVVCDIDGTLTRSDVLGYSAHKLGYDSAHEGVCEAFNAIEAAGYKVVYLSARPITKADKTRELLRVIGTGGEERATRMPEGPLITTAERSLPALVRTLRRGGSNKGADTFKMIALEELVAAFSPRDAAVQSMKRRPMVLAGGFGNRATDAQAYRRVGVPSNRIFIVDSTSRLCVRETREVFEGYQSLMPVMDRFFPSATEVWKRGELERLAGGVNVGEGGIDGADSSSSDEFEEGESFGYVDSSEEEEDEASKVSEVVMPACTPVNGESGGVGSGGGVLGGGAEASTEKEGLAGGEASGHGDDAGSSDSRSDEDDEGFDPDSYRRQKKKKDRARRVHEANVRWGFDPTGRMQLGEAGAGGDATPGPGGGRFAAGPTKTPSRPIVAVHDKKDVRGSAAVAPASDASSSPAAAAAAPVSSSSVPALPRGGLAAAAPSVPRKSLKEQLEERKREGKPKEEERDAVWDGEEKKQAVGQDRGEASAVTEAVAPAEIKIGDSSTDGAVVDAEEEGDAGVDAAAWSDEIESSSAEDQEQGDCDGEGGFEGGGEKETSGHVQEISTSVALADAPTSSSQPLADASRPEESDSPTTSTPAPTPTPAPPPSTTSSRQQLVGLGLTFRKSDGGGGLVIKRVKPGSAAALHCDDLSPGTRVTSISGMSLDSIDCARQLASLTQGECGSVCEIGYVAECGEARTISITRPLSSDP